MKQPINEDGLEALRRELDLGQIMALIERTARWVSPDTFTYLPLWYPEHARKAHFYRANWSEPQMNKNKTNGSEVHKFEGNVHANKALTYALGLRKDERPNWSCCHIWGVDDGSYQLENSIVQDPRFFSCVGNMVLLPTPLKAFTDVMPDVKMRLRVCATHLYGWHCDHPDIKGVAAQVVGWKDWTDYPASWPRGPGSSVPLGTVPLSSRIKTAADRRKNAIRKDLSSAGSYYPKEKVEAALEYWKIDL
jgi:hypothetical protein